MSELPEGWIVCKLPDVVFFQEGPGLRKYQYRDSGIPFLNIRTLVDEKVDLTLCKFLDVEEVEQKYRHFLLAPGDIVCSTSGTLGKTAVIRSEDLPLMLNTSVVRFRSLDVQFINQRYIHLYLKSDLFLEQAKRASTGSAQVNIGPSHLSNFDIPIPPFAEQKRIADKLDALLERVDRCRARLDRVPLILKRFRQAVLAAATSPDILGEKFYDIILYKSNLDEVATFINGFAFKSEWFQPTGNKQVIKIANVKDGFLDLDAAPAFISHEISAQYSKAKACEGDILISMTGTKYKQDYGFVGMATGNKELWVNQRVGIVRPDKNKILPSYLLLVLRSAEFRKQFFEGETGQVNQGNVGSNHIKSCNIQYPPLEEQHEIVRRVEILFAYADRLAARYQAARAQVARLTPALLAKAFRGELVAQDPADEPAGVLLERLRWVRVDRQGLKPPG